MTETDEQTRRRRSANATIAALTRAATTDGREIAAPAQRAAQSKFETSHYCTVCKRDFTIDPTWPPEQRARAVAAHKKLHFKTLQQRSMLARAAQAKAGALADEAEAQLAELDVS